MKRYNILLAFFIGAGIGIASRVGSYSKHYPLLTPELAELCRHGDFHPDCTKRN